MPTPSLRAQRLSFSFSDAPLLTDVTFHLEPGWTGLVGKNGGGKTTLLQLLSGALTPSGGEVHVQPRGAPVLLCPQRLEVPDTATRRFALADDRAAARWRSRLALTPWESGPGGAGGPWDARSPGERKRWQIAAALWAEPAVLLLDEPTNHLDAEASALLREALAQFRGVGVIVSHDRAVLDALTRATLRLHAGQVSAWPGPFSAASEAWAQQAQRAGETRALAKKALDREQRALDEQRRRLEASARSRSTGARMRSRHDSDARGLGANFRAEMAEQAHAAALRRTRGRAADVADALAALAPVAAAPGRLFLKYQPCHRPLVATLEGEVPRADGAALLGDVRLTLHRGARVVVRGPNGAGKSTLLRALVAAAALPEERVLSLAQELSLAESLEDLQALRALEPEARGRVLQLVDGLGVDPDALLATRAPSPGEGRKLRLALGLGRHVWLAVLDEPTNHLDLPAVERLMAALREFPGALVVVTHDEALAASLQAADWLVSEGRVTPAAGRR